MTSYGKYNLSTSSWSSPSSDTQTWYYKTITTKVKPKNKIKKTKSKFAVGDRVVLIEGHYTPRRSNPCIGSKYECTGTIDNIGNSITVLWDNGIKNGYSQESLAFANEHYAFKSIW